MKNEAAASPLDAFVSPILGLPAWGVQTGYGGNLSFDFGEPRLKVTERTPGLRRSAFVEGEWRLWTYCCHWLARQDGIQLAWSEDADLLTERAAARLNGQKLTAVAVDPMERRATFTFDLGGVLETWPYGDDATDEQWIIFSRNETFSYRDDGGFSRHPRTAAPEQEWRLPLR